jgi:quercetin dioxygenase-like cupin family protein
MEKKSLEEARVFAPDVFNRKVLFRHTNSTAFVLNFMPGQSLPPHRHPDHVLYLLVLEGSGTVTVDGAPTAIAAGDTICSEGEELFAFENSGTTPARLYAVLSKRSDDQ